MAKCVPWAALLLLGVAGRPAAAQITVRYEAPDVQASTAAGVSTATFNSQAAATSIPLTASNGLTGAITAPGNATITPANFDQYGGAGATGKYLSVAANGSLTLSLTAESGGAAQRVGYLGVWVSAIDGGNQLTFKSGSTTVAVFTAAALNALLPGTYLGNPNNRTQNGTEKYAYLNFYADSDAAKFDTVVFSQGNGGGFEFDNVSVLGQAASQSGTTGGTAGPGGFVPVPEPAGLLLVAVVGLLAWRRV